MATRDMWEDTVTIEGTFKRETDRAVLYYLDDYERTFWIPKSQVVDEDRGDGGFVEVVKWFYDKMEEEG